MAPAPSPINSQHVAVIGAGAAGLVAARELRREGHTVVVLDREKQVGGLWVYTPETESDELGLDPTRPIVHSSVYKSLRTNLPRECMGYKDFPFVPRGDDPSRDSRRYPSHREVLAYLQDFATEFNIEEMIRFETEVLRVEPVNGKWRVQSKTGGGFSNDEIYDAVVMCCGHFAEPNIAQIPGIESWPGRQTHSHSYRVPDPFKDEVVVVIGNFASGADISRDISKVAKEVHIASRASKSNTFEKRPVPNNNLWMHSEIDTAHEDGTIVFKNGKVVHADTIVHCTGYKYYFPFLETNNYMRVDDNRVEPLYKHIFPPALAPGLSFIGLPAMGLQFYMFEVQSKWVAAVLSGRVTLPSVDEMMDDLKLSYETQEALGIPKRYTHKLGKSQCEYLDWIADLCGFPHVEHWRDQEVTRGYQRLGNQPETFRDEWDDDDLMEEAYEDFARLNLINFHPSRFLESGR
ncbi:flavin-monooxygenase glucosinolate S-oxygenase 4 [Arabidopsis thaliana]|uniref:Flavin-containing monooxygenase FMO GS-OX4 n=1 Tax=Arabidopsis thaliana TaxID=3702 RepID=GSOX4_ARATH|nr:flavin-monooxygenase glucosinolate S-oxygenase 4 [Arabidopsis thaliana]Q93Y23.1 RecName: Full=Flavin-containing monooxygenase FMO GS-OX4; AltName: Full=Flavin-monooxygenase glucosinolate S-oxygenase 4 [Arabidopsis thaliana]AAK96833.1 similar to glutamate synthase [Arabidopsis thaliana]AAM10116.1 similar to glutamate synthase [Arabidopsis thaliana]AEE33979.1 flavin-monooxygenase glucosinolate S-oxygenase 4 [Arabidopsis thaliana]|eukprot:NP_564797.1 flavin-monooxygenase glucosinolate S-oxygenase 4 [Arabidopsis thaliana]